MHDACFSVAADHPAMAGHFPGRPVVPGALLLAEVIEAALDVPALAARLGSAPRVAMIKFLAPVVPPAELSVHFDAAGARVRFEVRHATQIAAAGQFETAAPQATAQAAHS